MEINWPFIRLAYTTALPLEHTVLDFKRSSLPIQKYAGWINSRVHFFMRCLVIDNYDSFTWNLVHYAAEAFGDVPFVARNDQFTWGELKAFGPFGCIIVSPGPGSVTNEGDFRVSRQAILQEDIPVFGVCLGFQGLAHLHGGRITYAPVPYHGRSSSVIHTGDALFDGIPSPFSVVRYHSLMVSSLLPADLLVTATTETGLIMALRHKSAPKWGVQFHPESILTDYGHRLIMNFRNLAHKHLNRAFIQVPASQLCTEERFASPPDHNASVIERVIVSRKLECLVDPENVFSTLYADHEHAFWLDSALVRECSSRFSFMGEVNVDNIRSYKISEDSTNLARGQAFLSVLEQDLKNTLVEGGADLPFEFRGGWIGYLTYEMKALFGAKNAHTNDIPDTLWMCAEKFLAFDHVTATTWAVAVSKKNEEEEAVQWAEAVLQNISELKSSSTGEPLSNYEQLSINLNVDHEGYIAAIEQCRNAIADGESYEVCLTNQFGFEAKLNAIDLYRVMRRKNAAPFGAFIKSGKLHLLSTSPERFLKVDKEGGIQAKPMKGTSRRSPDPNQDKLIAQALKESEKDRAENLMIVDLMRNDLSRVSIPGTVSVPKLMDIETYATVHQMVSTVESRLKPECTLIDLIRATFPGGSISGAPKLRTMEIIDKLEGAPRGVYCGAIGYLGYNRIADLNIGIRTLTYDGQRASFGAGGAITYLSDSSKEFDEIILKANALIGPIWTYLRNTDRPFEWRLNGNTMAVFSGVEENNSCIAG